MEGEMERKFIDGQLDIWYIVIGERERLRRIQ